MQSYHGHGEVSGLDPSPISRDMCHHLCRTKQFFPFDLISRIKSTKRQLSNIWTTTRTTHGHHLVQLGHHLKLHLEHLGSISELHGQHFSTWVSLWCQYVSLGCQLGVTWYSLGCHLSDYWRSVPLPCRQYLAIFFYIFSHG